MYQLRRPSGQGPRGRPPGRGGEVPPEGGSAAPAVPRRAGEAMAGEQGRLWLPAVLGSAGGSRQWGPACEIAFSKREKLRRPFSGPAQCCGVLSAPLLPASTRSFGVRGVPAAGSVCRAGRGWQPLPSPARCGDPLPGPRGWVTERGPCWRSPSRTRCPPSADANRA